MPNSVRERIWNLYTWNSDWGELEAKRESRELCENNTWTKRSNIKKHTRTDPELQSNEKMI